MYIKFTLTHCWHLDFAVDRVRDKPAWGKNVGEKTKVQSEREFDVADVHIEPRRLVVVVLHPLAHADKAGLLIRGLPRSANIHLHDQSSRSCVHLENAGVELRMLTWKLELKKVKVVNIGDKIFNGVNYERSVKPSGT